MKILRIRRGFTTNSSGANDYLPDGGLSPSASASASASASPSSSTPAREAGSATPSTASSSEAQDYSPFPEPTSNSTAAGAVFLVVIGAFVAGPLLRVWWKKRRADDTNGPGDHGA